MYVCSSLTVLLAHVSYRSYRAWYWVQTCSQKNISPSCALPAQASQPIPCLLVRNSFLTFLDKGLPVVQSIAIFVLQVVRQEPSFDLHNDLVIKIPPKVKPRGPIRRTKSLDALDSRTKPRFSPFAKVTRSFAAGKQHEVQQSRAQRISSRLVASLKPRRSSNSS
jgi:hypothetical protein